MIRVYFDEQSGSTFLKRAFGDFKKSRRFCPHTIKNFPNDGTMKVELLSISRVLCSSGGDLE
jgi:hypothetical protein